MDENPQDAGDNQRLRTQGGRLGQRIARYLFATLLVVSAIEYIPSYLNREQDLLRQIERQGARTMSVLLSENPDKVTDALERQGKLVITRTPVVGFVVYGADGKIFWSAGEAVRQPPNQPFTAPGTPFISRILGNSGLERIADGKRLETVWTQRDLGGAYTVAARLDTTQIAIALADYSFNLIWMALALAAVTSIVMLIVLNKLMLKPVAAIQVAISGARDDLGKAHEWVIENTSDRGMGEVTVAVNDMLKNVSENFRVVQKQNEKITQEAALRKEAEEEANLKHRQLVEAIEAFPGGFAVFDSEDRLMISNETWKEFHPDISDIIVPGVTFEEILRAGIAAERKRGHYDYGSYWLKDRLEQHRSGTTDMERCLSTGRWMRSTERRTEDGGTLGIWTDITERKAADTQRTELQAQFFQAQKSDAIGTLASGIAHDFDDLLAVILGNAKLLEAETAADSRGREELDAIVEAGNQAKDLVGQLLSVARQDVGSFELIDLYDVAEDALSLLRATLPKSITMETKLGRSATIFGDWTRMHQIVMNLCLNARDAIADAPGHVTVDLGDAYPSLDWPKAPDNQGDGSDAEQRVIFKQAGNRSFMWMGMQPSGQHIRLTVGDDGSGIDPDTFQKIFDPFFTTKESGKRSGLGLAAVLGIIQSHGGSIHVQSTPGEGTKFEIRIPRKEMPLLASPSQVDADTVTSNRILLIDDQDQTANGLEKSLELKGHEVTSMTDSTAAIEEIKSDPDRWDAVIADISKPGPSGVQTARDIHAIRRDLPVILCSGSAEAAASKDLDDPKFNTVLEKPVQETDLFEALEQCLKNTQIAEQPLVQEAERPDPDR